jgi:hypothetical protein
LSRGAKSQITVFDAQHNRKGKHTDFEENERTFVRSAGLAKPG